MITTTQEIRPPAGTVASIRHRAGKLRGTLQPRRSAHPLATLLTLVQGHQLWAPARTTIMHASVRAAIIYG